MKVNYSSWILFTAMIALCSTVACKTTNTTPQTANTPSQTENAAAAKCEGAYFNNSCLHVNDVINFGSYPQTSDKKEPLPWRVLEIDNKERSILLLSVNIIDAKPYNTTRIGITWEKCTLRKWLNSDFIQTAFDNNEQAQILTSHIVNENSNDANGGKETDDKVFLLSMADAYGNTIKSFTAESGMAGVTKYAVDQGATVWDSSDEDTWDGAIWDYELEGGAYPYCDPGTQTTCTARWWLRSPGYIDDLQTMSDEADSTNCGDNEDCNDDEPSFSFYSSVAALVGIVSENLEGHIHEYGFPVDDAKVGVRPVMRIKY